MSLEQAQAVYGAALDVVREADPSDVEPVSLARYMSGMELALELATRHPDQAARLITAFRALSHADELPGADHAHMQGARLVAAAIDGVLE